MDKAPDFGSGDCRFESCHGRCEVLLCPRSEDWYILDFRDNRKNEICILEKLMVKVRGHDNRIPVAIFPFIEENDNSSDINRN